MRQRLHINATHSTPEVIIDPQAGVFKLTGNVFPSDSEAFFGAIRDYMKSWLDATDVRKLQVELFFAYINTSSTKQVLALLRLIDGYYASSKDFSLRWYYYDYDTDMRDQGHAIMEEMRMPKYLVKKERPADELD